MAVTTVLSNHNPLILEAPGLIEKLPFFLFPLAFQRCKDNQMTPLLLVYLVYMVISSLWSDSFNFSEFWKIFWYGFLVFSFLMVTGLKSYAYPEDFEIILRTLVWLASPTAIVSIAIWYKDHPFPQSRLESINRMAHPI